jgi:hypothetical protein
VKLIKWGIFFIFAFTASFILLRTFSQPIFKESAPALVLGWITPAIPLYLYIAGGFVTGLALGLIAAAYNYISSTATIYAKSKRIRELEKEVDNLSEQQANMISHADTSSQTKKHVREPHHDPSFREKETEADRNNKLPHDDSVNSFLG